MFNLDKLEQKKAEIMANIAKAIESGDEEAFKAAFTEFTENLQEAVMAEAKGLIESADNNVLSGRGARALTTEEKEFYQKTIQAMKSADPKQALSDTDAVMPVTVIDSVFEDLQKSRPLLSEIDFTNTSGLIEYLVNTDSGDLATWDTLTAQIVTEITSGFEKIELTQKKLSAFLPVSKSMLDLGPQWLDRYVRAVLAESLASGLEKGIVAGDGLKEPAGMTRNINGALDPVEGLPAKTPVALTSFKPEAYGPILATMAVDRNGKHRAVNEVTLIVNPVDNFTKIMPATTQVGTNGYQRNLFPFPTKVVVSSALAEGEAILGIPKNYFMGIGTGKQGKIDFSDHYKFLEDERVYLVKLYGTGRPKDNTSFVLLDITGLEPLVPLVETVDVTPAV